MADSPKTFIQWKGTDVCMDLHCTCGEHNHYDGYFAHYVRCMSCGAVWELSTSVAATQVAEPTRIPPLEDESQRV